MIIEALLNVLALFFKGIGQMFTAMFPAVPGWAQTASDKVGQVTGVLYGVDSWIPVSLLFAVAGAVLAAYAVALVIGIVRVVASYLTLGGGAT